MTPQAQGANARRACPSCLAVFRKSFARCPLDGAVLGPVEKEPLLGVTLADRYVVEACIGEGGMGQVYRAKHTRISRRFAIKVLYGDLVADAAMRERFSREAEAASRLSHPNLVSVVDFGETDKGLLYLVMEFIEGTSLASLIAQHGPLGTERTLNLLRQLAAGLEHAHEKNLVHRDFKPDNVVIASGSDGELAKILDFGIARIVDDGAAKSLTTQGMVMGTPAFMAPEQATGGKVDHRSDLFSLGLVLYEMATGVLPFEGDAMGLLRQNFTLDFPPMAERVPGLKVDPRVERLANKLAAKKPKDRFQSASELIRYIDSFWAPARSRLVGADTAEPSAPDAAASATGEGEALGLARTAVHSNGAAVMAAEELAKQAAADAFASGRTEPGPAATAPTMYPEPAPVATPAPAPSDPALATTLRPDDPAASGPVPGPAPREQPTGPAFANTAAPGYHQTAPPSAHASAPAHSYAPAPGAIVAKNPGQWAGHQPAPPVTDAVAMHSAQPRRSRWPLVVLALLLCAGGAAVVMATSDTGASDKRPQVAATDGDEQPATNRDDKQPDAPTPPESPANVRQPTATEPPADTATTDPEPGVATAISAEAIEARYADITPRLRKLQTDHPNNPIIAKMARTFANVQKFDLSDPKRRQKAHHKLTVIERRMGRIERRKNKRKKHRNR